MSVAGRGLKLMIPGYADCGSKPSTAGRRPIGKCLFQFQVYLVARATSSENLFMPYVNNKGTDHPPILTSAFIVCCLDSIIPLLAIAKISRP